MKKTTKILSILLVMVMCLLGCSTAKNSSKAQHSEFEHSSILEELKDNATKTNDIVYCNAPNGLRVYSLPEETEDNYISTIPFLWGIDRIATFDDWSIISYNCKDSYVKTSDIITSKAYDVKNHNYDVVFSGSSGVDVYLMPNNTSTYLGNIPSYWGIDRILTLNNGWTMISYNCKNAFVQTSNLLEKVYIGDFQITYYCPCSICNGPWGPYDCFGNPLVNGTAAVDTSKIAFGTTFEIAEPYGRRICVARDVGGAIKGNHIDVFVNVSHSECSNMGNSYKAVYIYKSIE